jgi:hypothetical protein
VSRGRGRSFLLWIFFGNKKKRKEGGANVNLTAVEPFDAQKNQKSKAKKHNTFALCFCRSSRICHILICAACYLAGRIPHTHTPTSLRSGRPVSFSLIPPQG